MKEEGTGVDRGGGKGEKLSRGREVSNNFEMG